MSNQEHISTFSPELEASPSPPSDVALERFNLSSETNTAKRFSEDIGPTCQSIATSRTSKQMSGLERLSYLREGFRAALVRLRVKCSEVMTSTHDGVGLTPSVASATHDPDTRSWRTRQACFPWMEEERGLESYLTFTPSGMICSGKLWEVTPLVRPTKEHEFGCWLPTPSGVNGGVNHTAGRLDEWGGNANPFRGTDLGKTRCASFEEWMMGLPTHHTELIRSEMRSPRKSQKLS